MLRMMALPHTPATPRERRPSGTDEPHGLGQSGRLALDHSPGALRREVTGREARAAGGHDEAGEAVGHLDQGGGDLVGAVGGDAVVDHLGAGLVGGTRRAPRPERSSRVPWTTPSDTVSTFALNATAVTVDATASRPCRRCRRPGAARAPPVRTVATAAPVTAAQSTQGGRDRPTRPPSTCTRCSTAAPGRTRRPASRSSASCSAVRPSMSASAIRQRASGRRRSAPRPEHGASTRT